MEVLTYILKIKMCDCKRPETDLSAESCPLRPKYLQGLSRDEWSQWLQLVRSKPRDGRCCCNGFVVKVTYCLQFCCLYIRCLDPVYFIGERGYFEMSESYDFKSFLTTLNVWPLMF